MRSLTPSLSLPQTCSMVRIYLYINNTCIILNRASRFLTSGFFQVSVWTLPLRLRMENSMASRLGLRPTANCGPPLYNKKKCPVCVQRCIYSTRRILSLYMIECDNNKANSSKKLLLIRYHFVRCDG